MKYKRSIVCFIAICSVVFTIAGCDGVLEKIIGSTGVRMMKEKYIESRNILNDGNIHVILSGTGSPRIDEDRSHPCTVVVANGRFLIFDAGPSAVDKLALQGYPVQDTEYIFLTHMHSDHMGGIGALVNLSYNLGRKNVVKVYGPDDSKNLTHSLYPPTSKEYRAGHEVTTKDGLPDTRLINELTSEDLKNGVKWGNSKGPQYVYIPGVNVMADGINQAYLADTVIRTSSKQMPFGDDAWAHSRIKAYPIKNMPNTDGENHGWGELQHVLTIPDNGSGHGDLVIKAFLVDHYPCFPSYGFRIEYAGKVVVISGDTESLMPYEAKPGEVSFWTSYAQNADVFVHEATSMKMVEIMLNAVSADPELMKLPVVIGMVEQFKGAADHHTGVLDVARAAVDANAKKLVITHVTSPTPNIILKNLFTEGMDDIYTGEIILGEDGMDITIPVSN